MTARYRTVDAESHVGQLARGCDLHAGEHDRVGADRLIERHASELNRRFTDPEHLASVRCERDRRLAHLVAAQDRAAAAIRGQLVEPLGCADRVLSTDPVLGGRLPTVTARLAAIADALQAGAVRVIGPLPRRRLVTDAERDEFSAASEDTTDGLAERDQLIAELRARNEDIVAVRADFVRFFTRLLDRSGPDPAAVAALDRLVLRWSAPARGHGEELGD